MVFRFTFEARTLRVFPIDYGLAICETRSALLAQTKSFSAKSIQLDLLAGTVVFLLAIPLCLGIALASQAPMSAGLIAGIVGGIVVGFLSGSHTSVSGPAAGLAAVIIAEQARVGSFTALTLAVFLAGIIQIALGLLKAGFLASFFPSSVIKGLLAAIGIVLILKQLPHMLGRDNDPVGEMSFHQPDGMNTFTELFATVFDFHIGAAIIGLSSFYFLMQWNKIPALQRLPIPPPLAVVFYGLALSTIFSFIGGPLSLGEIHLVNLPASDGIQAFAASLSYPDFAQVINPNVYIAAFTIAVVASLETLLNLEAVDKIDPKQRQSPPNRELLAQGAGNIISGLLGGLPITSVIIRSSVNVGNNNQTKLSAIAHGFLLLGAVAVIPDLISLIPLSALASILMVTGLKLASPKQFKIMWSEGLTMFLPFMATIVTIVMVDLLVGVLMGLLVSTTFILYSHYRSPIRTIVEQHINGDVIRLQFANQVSFFNKPGLQRTFRSIPDGGRVLIDAHGTEYIDPDVLDIVHEFKSTIAPAKGIEVNLRGFKSKYSEVSEDIQFVDYTSRDLQTKISPEQVLDLLKQGNERFKKGKRLERDFVRQVKATSGDQSPLAVILGGIDSRTPFELIFDLGIGDVFSARVAGNVANEEIIGSIEYGTKVSGAKLVAVIGHTSCSAVTSAVDFYEQRSKANDVTGCSNLEGLIGNIQRAIKPDMLPAKDADPKARAEAIDNIARQNVLLTIEDILQTSSTIKSLVDEKKVLIVGGIYDVKTGHVDFFDKNGK